MKTLLAAIDFSPVTPRVVAEGVALARAMQARLIVLNVTTAARLVADYAALETLLSKADPQGKNGHTPSRMAAIRGDSLQVIGHPADVILQQAERCSVDYIILGSHGHSALFDVLMGGTATGVLRKATCPVIVIPSFGGEHTLMRRLSLRSENPLGLRRNGKRNGQRRSVGRRRQPPVPTPTHADRFLGNQVLFPSPAHSNRPKPIR